MSLRNLIPISTWKAILAATLQTEHQYFTHSVIAVAKRAVLRCLEGEVLNAEDLVSRFNKPIFPPQASSSREALVRDETGMRADLEHRYTEEGLDALSEFLRQCCLTPSLFRSAETMQFVGGFVPRSAIHPDYQRRFTTAVKELFTAGDITLLRTFPTLAVWEPYTGTDNGWLTTYAWLDDLQAREILQETLRTYLQNTEAAALGSGLSAQIQEIITQLDKFHSGPD